MPRHLRFNPPRLFLLRRWADHIAERFGGNVYLVGSAVRDDNYNPRDWDVRVTLTYEQFAERYASKRQRAKWTPREIATRWVDEYYGRTEDGRDIYNRWHYESRATGKEAYRKYLGLYVDFQAYPPDEWRSWIHKPYWRINN